MFNKLKKILVKDRIEVPEYQRIFKNVVGYDDIKILLHKMITSKYTNSVLLTGLPASSKTVFILELLDYFKDRAFFVDGTTASGMGMIDYLFDHPNLNFLLIDEIDKLNKNHQKVLLNVMETGILSDVKAKSNKGARQANMHLSIYATSNNSSNMPPPLLSRFIKLNLPEYNQETFTEICQKLLSRNYSKDHETIQTIVQFVWRNTRDIREAIAIAKIVDTPDEVKTVSETLRKYSEKIRSQQL